MAVAFLPIIPLMPSRPIFKLGVWSSSGHAQTITDAVFHASTTSSFPDTPPLISICTSLKVNVASTRGRSIHASHPHLGSLIIPFNQPRGQANFVLPIDTTLNNTQLPYLQVLEIDRPSSVAFVTNLLDNLPLIVKFAIRDFGFSISLLNRLATATPSVLLPKMTDFSLLQTHQPESTELSNNVGRNRLAAATLSCLKRRRSLSCPALKSLTINAFEDEESVIEELRSYTELLLLC